MKRITIDPVTRIEGHAKITIHLGDDGKVARTQFHVTQIRGFEKFTVGRPFYEMPGITSRVCGICPVSHLLASSKACDAILAVRIPKTAALLRELVHYAQFVQSHALSFFHLSSPDLLLGFDSDMAHRNIIGVIEKHPELARDGIELRKFGQHAIEILCKERVHPSWIVPGGMKEPLSVAGRGDILAGLAQAKEIARRALGLFKSVLDRFDEEIKNFGTAPMMSAGLVDRTGAVALYDGGLRFRDAEGAVVEDQVPAEDYATYIGEAAAKDSYMKSPYFRPRGFPAGIYRVGPLARLSVADRYGTPEADKELAEFRERFGRTPRSSFLYHYARLIEAVYALERMEVLLHDPRIVDTHVRARAGVNALEGIGVIEAPRGTLIHHYKVNGDGGIVWANLIVATGHNALAIAGSVEETAKHFVDGGKLQEGMLNRVSAVVRAYDPCLSCSTHAGGATPVAVELRGPDGALLDEART